MIGDANRTATIGDVSSMIENMQIHANRPNLQNISVTGSQGVLNESGGTFSPATMQRASVSMARLSLKPRSTTRPSSTP